MAKTTKNTPVASIGDQLTDEQKAVLASVQGEPSIPSAGPSPSAYERDVNHVVDAQEQEQQSPSIGDNSGSITVVEMVRQDIIDRFKDHLKFTSTSEAAADMRETMAKVNNAGNELNGPLVSRLAIDMADICYFAMTAKDKDGNPMPAFMPNEDMAKNLIAYVKKRNLLGTIEAVKDTGGMVPLLSNVTKEQDKDTAAKITVETVNPYSGIAATTLALAANRACLLVYGHATSVTIGYLRKSESSGKRFGRAQVWLRRDQVDDAEMEQFYSAICVPTKVVIPHDYFFHVKNGENVLEPNIENKDDSLRYLNDDWAHAKYMHHLADAPLVFDLVSKGSKLPTGMLLKAAPKARATGGNVGTQTEGTPTTLDDAKAQIAKQKTELRKAQSASFGGDVLDPTLWHAIDNLSAVARDVTGTKPFPAGLLTSITRLFCDTVRYRLTSYVGKDLPHVIGQEIAQALQMIETNVTEDNGDFYWVDDEGKVINKIEFAIDRKAA